MGNKMKIILISGKAESGKDTSANFIKKYLEERGKKVVIVKFADFLKSFLQKSIGWNGKKDKPGRSLLQQYGTNIIRENYKNTFTDIMNAILKGINGCFDYVIIPDVRFENEIYEIKKNFDCISLRVLRNLCNNLTEEQKEHESETALDDYKFDAYINNNSDLQFLNKACEYFCEFYLGGIQ